MNNFNLRMHRCFKLQVQEFQNASIVTWIRAAKFSLKNPNPFWRYEQNADWIFTKHKHTPHIVT